MVFHNNIKQNIESAQYDNELWRSRNGFKEMEVHNPPYRRNRDFKPVNYGTFKGIPNFKHAEPWQLLRNVRDFIHEDHNIAIKWTKSFITGSIYGALGCYLY